MKYAILATAVFSITLAALAALCMHAKPELTTTLGSVSIACGIVGFALLGLFLLYDVADMLENDSCK